MKKLLITATLLLAAAGLVQAQAPTTTGPTPSTSLADPTTVPIDGGASLLLASGVAYGLKRLRRAR
jgi:hypothetical protein